MFLISVFVLKTLNTPLAILLISVTPSKGTCTKLPFSWVNILFVLKGVTAEHRRVARVLIANVYVGGS